MLAYLTLVSWYLKKKEIKIYKVKEHPVSCVIGTTDQSTHGKNIQWRRINIKTHLMYSEVVSPRLDTLVLSGVTERFLDQLAWSIKW